MPSVLPQSISKYCSIKHVKQAINQISIYLKIAYLVYIISKHRAIRMYVLNWAIPSAVYYLPILTSLNQGVALNVQF